MEIPRIESLENLNETSERVTREMQEQLARNEEEREVIENAGKAAMEMLSGCESLQDMLGVLVEGVEKIENKELKEKFRKALKR
jgi:predicted dinucleotide-utilizing enzyme